MFNSFLLLKWPIFRKSLDKINLKSFFSLNHIRNLQLTLFFLLCCCAEAPPDPPQSSSNKGINKITTPSGIEIFALRTGWVDIKKTHRDLDVPEFLAIPAIFFGNWADWMPITSYLIRHPEGNFLVDTGPDGQINDDSYYQCDRRNGFFYTMNLRFFVPQDETLIERLKQIQVDPKTISKVLITHFHADHIGGVQDLPSAEFYTGEGNWPNHVGSFTCRLPKGFAPQLISWKSNNHPLFKEGLPFTQDQNVMVVPLPGHTPGHTGLLIRDGEKSWLFAGDATFDRVQSDQMNIAGVSQNFYEARNTQSLLKTLYQQADTQILPAHDPSVFYAK